MRRAKRGRLTDLGRFECVPDNTVARNSGSVGCELHDEVVNEGPHAQTLRVYPLAAKPKRYRARQKRMPSPTHVGGPVRIPGWVSLMFR